MTDVEYKACIDDIRKEVLNIRTNWSAPPSHIWIVDMPEFLDAAMAYMPGAHVVNGPMFQYSTIWGIDFSECEATADRPRGIWIEDQDAILHRVR